MNGFETWQTTFSKMKSFLLTMKSRAHEVYGVAASEMLVACGTLGSIRSVEVYAFSLCFPTVPWLPWWSWSFYLLSLHSYNQFSKLQLFPNRLQLQYVLICLLIQKQNYCFINQWVRKIKSLLTRKQCYSKGIDPCLLWAAPESSSLGCHWENWNGPINTLKCFWHLLEVCLVENRKYKNICLL